MRSNRTASTRIFWRKFTIAAVWAPNPLMTGRTSAGKVTALMGHDNELALACLLRVFASELAADQ